MIQYYVLFKSECRSNATRLQMLGSIQMLLQMRWIKDNSALRWQAKTSTRPCKIHVKNSGDKKTDLEGNSRRMQSSRTTGRDGWIVSIYMLTGGEETRFLDASRPWWRWVRRGSIWQVNGHTRFCQDFFLFQSSNFFVHWNAEYGDEREIPWWSTLPYLMLYTCIWTWACCVGTRNGEWIALQFRNCRDIWAQCPRNFYLTSRSAKGFSWRNANAYNYELSELISLWWNGS